MAIKCELNSDRERGPGHGILALHGLQSHAGPLQFVLMRNQGTEPYLGPGGNWQGNEVLMTAPEVDADGDALLARVGPELVDALVALSSNVAFRLTVMTDGGRTHGTLKINHPLLGSRAAAPKPPPPPPDPPPVDPSPPSPEAPEPIQQPDEEEVPPTAEAPVLETPHSDPADEIVGQSRPSKLALAAVICIVLLLAGAGAYAWFTCLIPGFSPVSCSEKPITPDGTEAAAEPVPSTDAATDGASPLDGNGVQPQTCKDLAPAQCIAAAQSAALASNLELARQLYQRAARMGSTEAMLRVGEMYDPDTWSAETSPETEPDWETAAFWYESAAQVGAIDGLLRAGRVLCGHAQSTLEIRRGMEFLEQAIAKGATDDAQALLSNCKGTQP